MGLVTVKLLKTMLRFLSLAFFVATFPVRKSHCVEFSCSNDDSCAADAEGTLLPPGLKGSTYSKDFDPKICVIVRTYWGHGRQSSQGLAQLLESLERQSSKNWEAVLIVMDVRPFEQLHSILEPYADKAWVYAELIGPQYISKDSDGMWSSHYHALLYNLTDQAIRACPKDSDWLLITNGDNQYSDVLFTRIKESAAHSDIVSWDYYSRYQRPTGPPCFRFSSVSGGPPCKRNLQRWCHTDLGANAFNYKRFMQEDTRFGALDLEGHTADHLDGLMIGSLVKAGWRSSYLESQCLYDHTPSPQRCARLNGVWDDTTAAELVGAGGRCITGQAALSKMEGSKDKLELVTLPLSSDGGLAGFGQANPAQEVLCLRRSDHTAGHQASMLFYGPLCMDEADATNFDWDMYESYIAQMREWDLQQAAEFEALQAAAEAAAEAGEKLGGAGELPPEPLSPPPPSWQVLPDPPPKVRKNYQPRYRVKYQKEASKS